MIKNNITESTPEKVYCITDDVSEIPTNHLIDMLPSYFERSNNVHKNAYLNWRFDEFESTENRMFNMAEGYFQAALLLVDDCIANNRDKRADIVIFPILFNVIHGIETFFKGFISEFRLRKNIATESKIEQHHNIKQLCETALKMTKEHNQKEMNNEFKFIKKFINLLYDNTSDMTFARYPIDKDAKNQFYSGANTNVIIDLYVLKQWITRIHTIADNSVYALEDM